MTSAPYPKSHGSRAVTILAVAGAAVFFAACSSSSKPTTSAGTNGPAATNGPASTAGSPTTTAGATTSNASVTVKVATLPGLGSVLVNGDGRTLYVLASEKGGKVTCTSAGGCTTIWPPEVVPSGMAHGVAGSGVHASSLGTVTSPSGDVRLTYAGWPLYTFVSDKAAGQATGQGVRDSFGVWWVLRPSGAPVTTSASSSRGSTPATSAPASGGAGF